MNVYDVNDYPTPPRSRETGRTRRGYSFVERPREHFARAHRRPGKLTSRRPAALVSGLRECVELRCPMLNERVDQLRLNNDQANFLLTQLIGDVAKHKRAEAKTDALVSLGAASRLARKLPGTHQVAAARYVAAETAATGLTRCVKPSDVAVDACCECRAGRACVADTWTFPFANWTLDHTNFVRYLNQWTKPDGHLAATAKQHPLLAAAQARAIARTLRVPRDGPPRDPTPVAQALDRLTLVEPYVADAVAQHLADMGQASAAVKAIDDVLPLRNGSTDTAWDELQTLRASILARQRIAVARDPRPFRPGHSAPENRPQRRRFTA